MVTAPAWTAGWYGIATESNFFSVQANDRARVNWGDGTRETFDINTDRDGDGTNETATIGHSFPTDGVYRIVIHDRANSPPAPDFEGRAYMFAGDTDGTEAKGSAGDDLFITGMGADNLKLGDGDDWASTGRGDDVVRGGAGDDFLLGGLGADRLFGDEGSDLIAGGDDDDELHGGDGMDYIYGGAGADRLFAEADGGYLDGEAGADQLFGGSGNDTFAFSSVSDTGTGRTNADHIYNFEQGHDRISVFGLFPSGFNFIGSSAFSASGAGEVRAEITGGGTRTYIYGDVNGDGAADFEIRMTGAYALENEDFGIFAT